MISCSKCVSLLSDLAQPQVTLSSSAEPKSLLQKPTEFNLLEERSTEPISLSPSSVCQAKNEATYSTGHTVHCCEENHHIWLGTQDAQLCVVAIFPHKLDILLFPVRFTIYQINTAQVTFIKLLRAQVTFKKTHRAKFSSALCSRPCRSGSALLVCTPPFPCPMLTWEYLSQICHRRLGVSATTSESGSFLAGT